MANCESALSWILGHYGGFFCPTLEIQLHAVLPTRINKCGFLFLVTVACTSLFLAFICLSGATFHTCLIRYLPLCSLSEQLQFDIPEVVYSCAVFGCWLANELSLLRPPGLAVFGNFLFLLSKICFSDLFWLSKPIVFWGLVGVCRGMWTGLAVAALKLPLEIQDERHQAELELNAIRNWENSNSPLAHCWQMTLPACSDLSPGGCASS